MTHLHVKYCKNNSVVARIGRNLEKPRRSFEIHLGRRRVITTSSRRDDSQEIALPVPDDQIHRLLQDPLALGMRNFFLTAGKGFCNHFVFKPVPRGVTVTR